MPDGASAVSGGLSGTAAMPGPWWSEFHSFTVGHAIALAWTVPLIVVSCWLGRRWLDLAAADKAHGQDARAAVYLSREKQLCSAWAGFIIGADVWSLVYWLQPAHYDPRESWPLHMCDIAALAAPLLFLTHWRPIRAVMYFWGIGLSTQAFISPTLLEGIGEQRYWLFWLGHLAIVGSAVYDLVVRRFRPMFRDFVLATAVTTVWYVGVAVLNAKIGSNYGYSGNVTLARPTLIDGLGPWPQRAYLLGLIAAAWFAVLWAVWPIWDRFRRT